MSRRATATILAFALASQGCAFLMHSERRNQPKSSTIDTIPLVVDLLWLIPGLIPGVVCLAVDFATNSIWVHPGQDKMELGVAPGAQLALRSVRLDEEAHVSLALMGPDGVIAQQETTWGPRRSPKIAVTVPQAPPSSMQLVLHVEGQAPITYEVVVDAS